MRKLDSSFQRTVNWNKYQSKVIQQTWNRDLDFLIDPSFQGVNRIFVLSLEDRRVRENYEQYFLPTVEIKDYNVVINGINFFDRTVKNNLRTYDNVRKIAIGQGDDYTTGCLIDYPCFKNYYKLTAVDLSKQQKLDADPIAKQKVNFTGNLDQGGNTQMFFIIEEAKEAVLDFSKGPQKDQLKCYDFIFFKFNFNIK